MRCSKEITMTGYVVRYVDLREPKPRQMNEDTFILEKGALAALVGLGVDVADFITGKYSRSGYHVTGVERIQSRRTADIDLTQLWNAAAAAESEVSNNG